MLLVTSWAATQQPCLQSLLFPEGPLGCCRTETPSLLLLLLQKDNPTHADVDELHARVSEAVRQLYERHRDLLPELADRHLEIV